MKKRIKTKRKKVYSKKIIFIITMLLLGLFLSYKKLSSSNIKIKNNQFLDLIVENTIGNDNNKVLKKLITETKNKINPLNTIKNDYSKYLIEQKVLEKELKPLIYIYNTHQSEEYYPSNYIEFSINPTVTMNDYILEDIFEKNGLETIVEESSISSILNEHSWKYNNSYQASRLLLESAKEKYHTLKYFIDVHRDSLPASKTTVEIDGKSYAKILFIIGLENKNYQDNLNFTEQIQEKLVEKYPNLSKGIYKKSGSGVNGIYNQDFSPYTILIEIGGYENTTVEVLNSTLAFAECFMEVINEKNNQNN